MRVRTEGYFDMVGVRDKCRQRLNATSTDRFGDYLSALANLELVEKALDLFDTDSKVIKR